MILQDWIKKEGTNRFRLAQRMNCSHQTVYNIFNGRKKISQKMAVRIEEMTKGEVSRAEAMWPEQYIEKLEDGSEQMIMPLQRVRKESKFKEA